MRLYLKNIGFLKEADVRLDGLTVIAGENDTGKSTVGKVIFSILKGLQKYEESLRDEFRKNLFLKIDEFYENFHKINKDKKLEFLFFPPFFVEEILKRKNHLNDFLKKYKSLIEQINNRKLKKDFEKLETEIKKILLSPNKQELRELAIEKAFFSEFKNQLKLVNSNNGLIELSENNKLIKIEIKDRIILRNAEDIFLEDVTLIESPIILNFSDMIQSAKSYFEEDELKNSLSHLRADVIYHCKDLMNKLIISSKYGNYKIDKNLLNILKFDFEYDDFIREFLYLKGNNKFSSINVSDGIKSFGIIKLLLKGGYIRKNTLLVIDEPEVHLHPKWQVKYAKLLVDLIRDGINILVTSHSPFFIDAIDKLSYDININYYFAEDGLIKEDKDLELMYKKLNVVIDELEDLEIDEMVYKVKNESSKK